MENYKMKVIDFIKENPSVVKTLGSAIGSVIGTIVASAVLKLPVFKDAAESAEDIVEGVFVPTEN